MPQRMLAATSPQSAAMWLFLPAALLLATAAFANDTTLNVNVDPPRQLSEFDLPVRMAAEHITIRFGRERSQVEVEFTFENLSEEDVYCEAGFPDEDLLTRWANYAGADAGGQLPSDIFPSLNALGDLAARQLDDASVLTDFEAWSRPADAGPAVNEPLETKLLRIERIAYEPEALQSLGAKWPPSEYSSANNLMFCHSFTLQLGPRERRVIGHRYSTLNGSNVLGQRLFSYTLGTGRSWAGTIGEALIDVYLVDTQSFPDLHFRSSADGYSVPCNPDREGWELPEPGHLRARWTDFEPSGAQGFIMLATQPLPIAMQ